MKGSKFANAPASYGIKGTASAANDPGGRWTYSKWKDSNGNFWLMGGFYQGSSSRNDVWKYDLNLNQWIWMSGTNVNQDAGQYIANCVFDTAFYPKARMEQRGGIGDNCGRLWLFGGSYGLLPQPQFNDLWVFDPQLSAWNWLGGVAGNQAGNYGTLRVPLPTNMPPSRAGNVAWWGNNNKFYTFGGQQGSSFFSDVWMFDPDSNCIPTSCSSSAVLPPVAGFTSSDTMLCAFTCLDFTDQSTNATSWLWTFSGGSPSSSTAQNPKNICYLNSGYYDVTLIASNPGGRDTLKILNYIYVLPFPPTPTIIQSGDTLFCTTDPTYASYQWYLDSTLLSGETDTFYVHNQYGNFNVAITDTNGCQISVGIYIMGMKSPGVKSFVNCYPNPVTGKLVVSVSKPFQKAVLEGYTLIGEKLFNKPLVFGANEDIIIDFSIYSPGIYFISFNVDGRSEFRKIIKAPHPN